MNVAALVPGIASPGIDALPGENPPVSEATSTGMRCRYESIIATQETEQINGHRFTFQFGPEWQRNRVIAFAEELKKEAEDTSGIFGFLDSERGKVNVFFAASKGAMAAGVDAGKAVEYITGVFAGRGGGKPHLGQGGFPAADLEQAQLVARLKEAAQSYFANLRTERPNA